MPFTQEYDPTMTVVVRTGGDPVPMVEQLRRTIVRVEPQLATLVLVHRWHEQGSR